MEKSPDCKRRKKERKRNGKRKRSEKKPKNQRKKDPFAFEDFTAKQFHTEAISHRSNFTPKQPHQPEIPDIKKLPKKEMLLRQLF